MFQRKTTLCSPFIKATLQLLIFVVATVAILSQLNLPATATTTYKIIDGDNIYRHTSSSTDPSEVLSEVGISHSDVDLLSATADDHVVSLSITRRQYVTVTCDGVPYSILAESQDTVADVLEYLNIEFNDYDYISMDPDEPLGGETTSIEITHATISYTSETTAIPYSTIYTPDVKMDRGTEELTTVGKDGSSTTTYRVIELEGQETRYEAIQTTTVDPIDEVYTYGTKVEFERPTGYSTTSTYITNIDDVLSTFTTSDGETYSFSDTLTLDATAYTAKAGAICSTGRLARVGVVAVDPDYIPYGTEMFIMSADGSFVYGLAIAGDCGGAIDDWDVDLYMTSRDRCINFGRQDVVAYVIESDNTESV